MLENFVGFVCFSLFDNALEQIIPVGVNPNLSEQIYRPHPLLLSARTQPNRSFDMRNFAPWQYTCAYYVRPCEPNRLGRSKKIYANIELVRSLRVVSRTNWKNVMVWLHQSKEFEVRPQLWVKTTVHG